MRSICLLFVVFALATIEAWAYADTTDWWWSVDGYADNQITSAVGQIGVDPALSDNCDPSDALTPLCGVRFGTYHVNGQDAWIGQTGFYSTDFRSPLPAVPGASRTWTIYLWADPVLSGGANTIGIRWMYIQPPDFVPPSGLRFAVTLKAKPIGITGGPALATVYDLSAHNPSSVYLPIYRTTNGLDGYVFDFTATVVPEPSALAALGFGLLPLGGSALRRRRRM
jgi:hypothetical protein